MRYRLIVRASSPAGVKQQIAQTGYKVVGCVRGAQRGSAGGAQRVGAREAQEGLESRPTRIEICARFIHGGCNRRGACRDGKQHLLREQIDANELIPICQECCTVDFCPRNTICDICSTNKETVKLHLDKVISDRNDAIANLKRATDQSIRANATFKESIREATRTGSKAAIDAKENAKTAYAEAYAEVLTWMSREKELTKQRYAAVKNMKQPRCTHVSCTCDQCKYGNCSNRETCFRSHNVNRRQDKLDELVRYALQRSHVICSAFAETGRCTNQRCNYSHMNLCETFRLSGECSDSGCTRDHYMAPEPKQEIKPRVERVDTPTTLQILADDFEEITREFEVNVAQWRADHPIKPIQRVVKPKKVIEEDEDEYEYDDTEDAPRNFRFKWKMRYGKLPRHLTLNTASSPIPTSQTPTPTSQTPTSQTPTPTSQTPTPTNRQQKKSRKPQEDSSPDNWSGLQTISFGDMSVDLYFESNPRAKPPMVTMYNFISITTMLEKEAATSEEEENN